MASDPTVTVIVLNWNGGQLLHKCVESLVASAYPKLEIIVSDNGSTDESETSVERLYPMVTVMRNHSNLGFSCGNNVASRIARGEILIFSNNDVVVQEDTIRKLVETLQNPEVGIVSPAFRYPSSSFIYGAGATMHKSGYLIDNLPDDYSQIRATSIVYPEVVEGAFLAMRRSLFLDIGMFDENLESFFEDVDLCLRVTRSGHKVAVRLDCVILHARSATWSSSFRLQVRKSILNHMSRMYFLLKYCGFRGLLWAQLYEVEFFAESLLKIAQRRTETQVTNRKFEESGRDIAPRTTLGSVAAMIILGRLIAFFLLPKVFRNYGRLREQRSQVENLR